MSKPSSKRAAAARDWPAIWQDMKDGRSAREMEERSTWLQRKNPPPWGWGEEYLHAAQQALEQRKPETLLMMLDWGLPVPPVLLPVLAEVIRDARQGRSIGQPSKLTIRDDHVIRFFYDRLTFHNSRGDVGEAQVQLAESHEVDVSTIKRSLARTKEAIRKVQKRRPLRPRQRP